MAENAKVTRMAKRKPRVVQPANDPVAREKQLINLAVDLAAKQLADGSASPSVINHYLKLASTREAIEREMLEKQVELISAKAAAIAHGRDSEDNAKAAIEAMKSYTSSN